MSAVVKAVSAHTRLRKRLGEHKLAVRLVRVCDRLHRRQSKPDPVVVQHKPLIHIFIPAQNGS